MSLLEIEHPLLNNLFIELILPKSGAYSRQSQNWEHDWSAVESLLYRKAA
jgi:hypothetical protein